MPHLRPPATSFRRFRNTAGFCSRPALFRRNLLLQRDHHLKIARFFLKLLMKKENLFAVM